MKCMPGRASGGGKDGAFGEKSDLLPVSRVVASIRKIGTYRP
jgi:hypothetical protein